MGPCVPWSLCIAFCRAALIVHTDLGCTPIRARFQLLDNLDLNVMVNISLKTSLTDVALHPRTMPMTVCSVPPRPLAWASSHRECLLSLRFPAGLCPRSSLSVSRTLWFSWPPSRVPEGVRSLGLPCLMNLSQRDASPGSPVPPLTLAPWSPQLPLPMADPWLPMPISAMQKSLRIF